MKQNDEPAFPVATITTGPQPKLGAILIRFDFLTNLMQPTSEANPGRNYLLTPIQARYLVEKILSALPLLENAAPQETPHQKH